MTTNGANHQSRATSRVQVRLVTTAVAAGAALLMTVAPARAQPVETVLHAFTGGADGAYPNNYGSGGVGLILDKNGALYGTAMNGGSLATLFCGATGCGVVFQVDATGNETVLYSFTGPPDGAEPGAGLVRDEDGNFYGTTLSGGAGSLAAGTVFKLGHDGIERVLYSFSGGADGNTPYAGVMRDEAGNLYGTTTGGGAFGAGVVYKVDPSGSETVLYNFCSLPHCADGANPSAGVIRDPAGKLYGTTAGAGGHGKGVVFVLDPASGEETVLHSFTGGADGGQPFASLIRDDAGNLYGTASSGGDLSKKCTALVTGCGVVFKLDPQGNETVLYTFTGGADGSIPYGRLLLSEGKLYGTTYGGGSTGGSCHGLGCGVAFTMDTAGNETVVYTFTGGADGENPTVGLVGNTAGLFGTTQNGGDLTSTQPACPSVGCGLVFKVGPKPPIDEAR